jgi:AcrR family transcriptional regulator
MGRPREHDLDSLLDHARQIWIERGAAALTIRALSAASTASNGAIYHAFGTRAGVLAAVWAREATGYLAHLRARIESVSAAAGQPVELLLAAGLAPLTYASSNPAASRLLLTANLDELFTPELDDDQRASLAGLRTELGQIIVSLAGTAWGRTDRAAVKLTQYCVVELPGALLLSAKNPEDPLATLALENAIRGIAATDLPPVRTDTTP